MLEQVEPLWREGVTFFKAFTCTTHGVPGLGDVRLRDLFERVAALGAVCLVHSEDETLTAEAEHALRATGRTDPGRPARDVDGARGRDDPSRLDRPRPLATTQKASGSIWEAPFGLPGLDTTLPVLLDGAALGLLSYERVAEAYAGAPARAYGLFPRKGGVAGGRIRRRPRPRGPRRALDGSRR